MVDINDIKRTLVKITEAVNMPYNELWVGAGGALVAHGLREKTHDIDANCSSHYLFRIAHHFGRWPKILPACNDMPSVRYISIRELNIDIFEEIEPTFTKTMVNDIWAYDLKSLLKQKQMLNRDKDQDDIAKIRNALTYLTL